MKLTQNQAHQERFRVNMLVCLFIGYLKVVTGSKDYFNMISFSEFQDIKKTETINTLNEAYSFLNENDKKIMYASYNNQFFQEIEETWNLAADAENVFQNQDIMTAYEMKLDVTSPFFPFLVCVNSKNKSGYERMKALAERFHQIGNSHVRNSIEEWSDFGVKSSSTAGSNSPVYPMHNSNSKTCFSFTSLASEAKGTASYNSESISTLQNDDFLVIPFTPSMKIEKGTVEEIQRRFAYSGTNNSFIGDLSKEEINVKLSVQLSPATGDGTQATAMTYGYKLITICEALANEYYTKYQNRRHRSVLQQDLSSKDESKISVSKTFMSMLKEHQHNKDNNERHLNLLNHLGGPCSNALQYITFEPYSLGHSFDITIASLNQDEQMVKCVTSFLRALALQPEILSIAAIPEFKEYNYIANEILQGSQNSQVPYPFHNEGFTGKDQVVAVSDTGVDQENCYFYDENGTVPTNGFIDKSKRKIIQYYVGGGDESDPVGGHGTHVCGTVLGQKFIDGKNVKNDDGNGIAPEAKLAFCDIGADSGGALNPSSDMKFLLEPGKMAGANVHSASWGAFGNFGTYTYYCQRFDEYLYLNQDFLVTMAAGNSGKLGISWPSTAKNVLSIGATVNNFNSKDNLAYFSGQGEVEGNRIKPDLVAPGGGLLSANAGSACGLIKMSGTSMATPAVAGIVAIITQYLKENGMKKPSGSLIKSILMNGGTQLKNRAEFDSSQGFGLVNLMQSLPLKGHNKFGLLCQNLEDISEETSMKSITITIDTTSGCSSPLSVTMSYTDPAGSSIFNDLDLEVENQTGDIYYPNGLNRADKSNIAERTRIDGVENGDQYIIRVVASNLIQFNLPFSLVVTGCFVVSENNMDPQNTLFISSKDVASNLPADPTEFPTESPTSFPTVTNNATLAEIFTASPTKSPTESAPIESPTLSPV